MKPILLLITCLLLAGCGQNEGNNQEVLSKLDNLKSELAAHQSQPVRWATANKRSIEEAIYNWSRVKTEQSNNAEALTSKQKEDLQQYEVLQNQLARKSPGTRISPMTGLPANVGNPEEEKEYEALSQKVEAAEILVHDILERRAQLETQYRAQYTPENLVAEYVKDRFDLVVDSSEASFNRSAVLYSHSGEALDITEGVIKLFKEKTAK
ncbi:MAG TPA: hypothetical protein VNN22_09815 [Verrucomicrobiae bacterium]|nr:hypothetical protein [Verrucomicrobiae bacterium]